MTGEIVAEDAEAAASALIGRGLHVLAVDESEASFARTLGTLHRNGISLVKGLEITAGVLSNHAFHSDTSDMVAAVREGSALSKALSVSGLFPDMVEGIISVGEESGSLDESLLHLADEYERDVERQIKVVMTLMEPVMIVVVGAIVGFIVMAMLLPIFEMGDTIQV